MSMRQLLLVLLVSAGSLAGSLIFAPLAAVAQTPTAPASGAASPEPVTGVTYGPNDPCTSIGAIVSRPSQTTSVCTVRPNHVLIETGYQNTSADATSRTVQIPQALVRIGTTVPALELDLGLPTGERFAGAGGMSSSGTTDVGAGLKYVLGYGPQLSYGASVFFTAPTGNGGISSGTGTQSYDANVGYKINNVLSLAGTLSFNTLAQDAQQYSSFIPSLVLTAALSNATGVFVEEAEFTHGAGPGTATRAQWLGGITTDLSPRLQLDLEAGRSPTTATGKYRFVGLGASYYF